MRGPITVCLTVLLAGCPSGSDSSTPSPKTEIVQSSQHAPVELDRSASLEGQDANGDGVRDDIAAWIQNTYPTSTQRQAAMQAARAMQGVFTVDLSNPAAVREVNLKLAEADSCLYQVFIGDSGTRNAAEVSLELEQIATNTRARAVHYLAFNKAMDGAIWSIPRGSSCE